MLLPGPLGRSTDPFQEQETARIMDDIGLSDPHGCSGNPHCTDK